ncbi:ATP-dependent DNA helicase PIF1-like [Aphis craccivora]|uniref:ATP-dependent DNA helicase PIF1-like n=1 Tax=Aphis craccivora TaxID=307492 RepID=A0A6G0Z1S4_APHCR|nr:ATP-dependent DNA helicase PIF1-like [Aphis craccivora]
MAGIGFREKCFSHGQFYVTYSRVSSASSLVILAPKEHHNVTRKAVHGRSRVIQLFKILIS